MIIKWIKNKIKEHNKKMINKLEQENEATEKEKDNKEQELEKARNEMFETRCPIENGFCTDLCVHFQDGEVFFVGDPFDDCAVHVCIKYPKCKLWRK